MGNGTVLMRNASVFTVVLVGKRRCVKPSTFRGAPFETNQTNPTVTEKMDDQSGVVQNVKW
jgi:hypothetical protein